MVMMMKYLHCTLPSVETRVARAVVQPAANGPAEDCVECVAADRQVQSALPLKISSSIDEHRAPSILYLDSLISKQVIP
jgi:hypothetical protein